MLTPEQMSLLAQLSMAQAQYNRKQKDSDKKALDRQDRYARRTALGEGMAKGISGLTNLAGDLQSSGMVDFGKMFGSEAPADLDINEDAYGIMPKPKTSRYSLMDK
jgi:hypothetical protein